MGFNFQSKPNLGWERKQRVWGSLVREQGDPGWFQAPCHLCQEWGKRSFHNYFSIPWYQTYLTTLIAQVRITVFDDGLEGKDLPTGFNADVEGELDSLLDITSRYLKNNLFNISVIDLFDAGQYSSLRKTNAYSSVRKLAGRSLVRWAWQFWGQKMQQFWGKKLRALSHQNFCQIAYFVTTRMQLACNAIMRDFEEGSVPKAWKTMWGHFPIPTWYRGK